MCNAWNHPIDCACGWGGSGHHGRFSEIANQTQASGLRSQLEWESQKFQSEVKSYINPNARCPVCSAPVFFYQSPEGGRVFFDELGPPWHKHPCTEVRQLPLEGKAHTSGPTTIQVSDLPEPKRYAWQNNEWEPFVCETIAAVPPDAQCTAISGLRRGAKLVLFILESDFTPRAPYLVKYRDASTYFLATVQSRKGICEAFNAIAYRHLLDALRSKRSKPAANSEKAVKKALPRHLNKKPNAPLPIRHEQPKTAIEIAFERTRGRDNLKEE